MTSQHLGGALAHVIHDNRLREGHGKLITIGRADAFSVELGDAIDAEIAALENFGR